MTPREVLEQHWPEHGMHSVARYSVSGCHFDITCSCGERFHLMASGEKVVELKQALRNAPKMPGS